jgi:hypothetical protein
MVKRRQLDNKEPSCNLIQMLLIIIVVTCRKLSHGTHVFAVQIIRGSKCIIGIEDSDGHVIGISLTGIVLNIDKYLMYMIKSIDSEIRSIKNMVKIPWTEILYSNNLTII